MCNPYGISRSKTQHSPSEAWTSLGGKSTLLSPGLLIWDGPFVVRLNGSHSGGLYGPYKQQTGEAPVGYHITPHGPSMVRLLNAARAIFGPSGIFKREGLHMARLWPAYLMRHRPFLVHLVFSNEKAWLSPSQHFWGTVPSLSPMIYATATSIYNAN